MASRAREIKVKRHSSTMEQLFQMMAPNQRFSQGFVISIFLNACESWTLTAELEKRMQAFEMRCYRRLLIISYKDHVTYEEVRKKIQAAIGDYVELLALVKKRKLRWFGHVSRSSGLAKITLQGKN